MSDRYEQMDHAALVWSARRMDRELTALWRFYDNLSEWVMVTVTCGYCGAGDCEPCRTKSGALATYRHADRNRQMQEIRGEWADD
jgi:hypothetical protein